MIRHEVGDGAAADAVVCGESGSGVAVELFAFPLRDMVVQVVRGR
ncbi:hypothetical protein [Streptomyces sp. NPDC060322]